MYGNKQFLSINIFKNVFKLGLIFLVALFVLLSVIYKMIQIIYMWKEIAKIYAILQKDGRITPGIFLEKYSNIERWLDFELYTKEVIEFQ